MADGIRPPHELRFVPWRQVLLLTSWHPGLPIAEPECSILTGLVWRDGVVRLDPKNAQVGLHLLERDQCSIVLLLPQFLNLLRCKRTGHRPFLFIVTGPLSVVSCN